MSCTVAAVVLAGCADFSSADSGAGDDGSSEGTAEASTAVSSTADATTLDSNGGTQGGGPTTGAQGSTGAAESTGSADASTGPAPAGGPYPLVLAHGFFGFEDFAGAGFVDYFWQVVPDLAEIGETEVFTPAVDPFNDSTERGLQLLAAVEAVIAETGAEKVTIIGHSQGGLDARVVASMRPDLVAAVMTVSTPHGGTPIADYVLFIPGGAVIDTLLQILGGPLWGAIGNTTSLIDSMEQFSEAGIAEFNATYPDAPGVAYFSIAGRSGNHNGQGVCESDDAPPFLANWSTVVDPIDPLFAVAEAIVDGTIGQNIANDGLVRVEDAKWGTFLGCIPADHVDEIGHLFGDGPGGNNQFDHKVFYRNVVGYLRAQGL